jgi:phosphohistidine phosphatase
VPETRQLFVLRHAKSSWDDPGQDDHERPLAPRGRKAVKVLNKHVREHGIRPQQVLCSSARRTRETFEGVAPEGELLLEPELYAASVASVLERLQRVPDEIRAVMVIGHNPAMQTLVLRLARGPAATASTLDGDGDGDLESVGRKFPTGALATLRFDGPWSELRPGSATLTALVRPKDLH